MTNNEAIYALEGIRNDTIVMKPSEVAALDMAIEALQEKEKNRWVPVSEKLPVREGWYYVTRQGKTNTGESYPYTTKGCFKPSTNEWYIDNDNNHEPSTDIIAWKEWVEPKPFIFICKPYKDPNAKALETEYETEHDESDRER